MEVYSSRHVVEVPLPQSQSLVKFRIKLRVWNCSFIPLGWGIPSFKSCHLTKESARINLQDQSSDTVPRYFTEVLNIDIGYCGHNLVDCLELACEPWGCRTTHKSWGHKFWPQRLLLEVQKLLDGCDEFNRIGIAQCVMVYRCDDILTLIRC